MDFQMPIINPFSEVPEIVWIVLSIFFALCLGLAIFSEWIRSVIPNQTRQYIKIVSLILLLVVMVMAIKNPEYITALF
ncbi:hypothetical protein CON03_06985 [Bacillus cereus]|nr:hypothetical protein CON03_06985 [Bacillus cereus]PFN11860.1 hypothetical protein COJ72_29730 [Bacillus cereus]